jgi:2-methylcitrate dehydratase PrpD
MHPHGTWGGLGGAAALASLYRLDAAQIKTYLNIVSSLSLATSRQTMLEGGTVRNVYTGVSNQMAHIGYQLLQAGFSGETDGIKSVFGGVVSSSFDDEKACELIGTRFEVTRNYFKLHACCRYNHAALDALWQLMDAHSALADITMISAIDVSSYFLAAELADQAPQNVLAGKFSIPFAIATTLVNRSSKVHSFTSDAVANPTILSLARKVTVREDPTMSAKLPDLRPATVIITLVNGDVLAASVETNRGDWQDPYTPAQIKDKYLSLTTRVWSDEKAEDVFAAIMNMDDTPAPSSFIERL